MLTDRCIRGVGGSSHGSATNPRNIFSNHYREVHGKVDHRKSDRWLSYRFYSTSQRQKLPLRYVCEIFGARRFSSFSTQSAMSGRPFHNRSFCESSLRACSTKILGLPNEITPLPKHQPTADSAARSVQPAQVGGQIFFELPVHKLGPIRREMANCTPRAAQLKRVTIHNAAER